MQSLGSIDRHFLGLQSACRRNVPLCSVPKRSKAGRFAYIAFATPTVKDEDEFEYDYQARRNRRRTSKNSGLDEVRLPVY